MCKKSDKLEFMIRDRVSVSSVGLGMVELA